MNLFLDDIRHPPTDGREWTIARSCEEARAICRELGRAPDYVSFDHDLGEDAGEDAPVFVRWLIDQDLDRPGFIPEGFGFTVHSANPPGARNIQCLMGGYLAFRANATAASR